MSFCEGTMTRQTPRPRYAAIIAAWTVAGILGLTVAILAVALLGLWVAIGAIVGLGTTVVAGAFGQFLFATDYDAVLARAADRGNSS
jgi:hypothetical protein